MEFRPPTEPVEDPFFAAVRRRHRDVDLVLLPPEPAPGLPDGPVLDAAEVRAVAARVTEVAAELTEGLVDDAAEIESRFRFGPVPETVEAVARAATRSAEGYAALLTLRARLEAGPWDLSRPPGGPVERLAARRDDLMVTASYAEATALLAVIVSSTPLRVADAATARRLVTGQGSDRE